MSIIIPGQKQSDDSIDFTPTSQQINTLNNMHTFTDQSDQDVKIKHVQLGFQYNFQTDLNLQNINVTFQFPYLEHPGTFITNLDNPQSGKIVMHELQAKPYQITNFNPQHSTTQTPLQQIIQRVCDFYSYVLPQKLILDDGEATFQQELVYDKELIKQNTIRLTYDYKCIQSTSHTFNVDVINNSDVFIDTNDEIKELRCFINSVQLRNLMKFNILYSTYRVLILGGVMSIPDSGIYWTFKYRGTPDANAIFGRNCLFFAPVNISTNNNYYATNKLKTGLVDYLATDKTYHYETMTPFKPKLSPKWLFFNCPQLANQNYSSTNGNAYNIISKSINTLQLGQYFTITTTEPLKKLTLQNLANITFKINIYDENFQDCTASFNNAQLIIELEHPKYEDELDDNRKAFQQNLINVLNQ